MIVQYPDSILQEKCREVRVLDYADLRSDIRRMTEALLESGGVGIAAPQVGISSRIAIIKIDDEDPIVMLNPRISRFSRKYVEGVEACLSIPGRKFLVHRPKYIWYSYTDSCGTHVNTTAEGFRARVVMHEVDHLNGITIIDRGKELP